MEKSKDFEELVAIMDRLRGPDGCPWDREQTYETLRRFLLEECYEVADAIDRGSRDDLREELGDLLFQIVFLSRLAKEEGHFTVNDVIEAISGKMVRRHPHVFGSDRAASSEQVLRRWEELKRQERDEGGGKSGSREPDSILNGIPTALPAMMTALQMGARAGHVGFEWSRDADVFDKIDEELAELREAVASKDRARAEEELGDLLFTAVMLARRLDLDPEAALEKTNLKFRDRFRSIELELRNRGLSLDEADLELMDRIWNEAKANGPGDEGLSR